MGNDEELVKTSSKEEIEQSKSLAFDGKPRDEEIQGFDEARVLENEKKIESLKSGGDDIDVNMPLMDPSTRKNLGDQRVDVEDSVDDDHGIEKQSEKAGFVNGEMAPVEGIKGGGDDDGGMMSMTHNQKEEKGFDDDGKYSNSNDDNTEVVGNHGGEGEDLKTPKRRGRRVKSDRSNSNMKGESVAFSSGISQRTRNRVVRGKKEVDVEDMDVKMKGSEVDGEGYIDCGFSVGDFVWGKIKSHPWWPGRIYSPSNASEFALKYKHEGRVLVAYFGDGTFAWCDSSQLKPFEENFDEMSKQSGLKSFVSAMEEAVEEFGRLVEQKMTCSCATKGSPSPFLSAANAGIKEGVHVLLDGFDKFSVDQFEPRVMLDKIRNFVRFDSVVNMLEMRVLKSLVSVFYRFKGVHWLATYYEPMGIEELVHSDTLPNKGSAQAQGPDDQDWFVGRVGHSLMPNGPETSGKRKVKRMVEILGLDIKPQLEENHVDVSEGKMQPRELRSASGKKRYKLDDNGPSGDSAMNSVQRRRKINDGNQGNVAENSRVTRSSAKKIENTEKFATARKRSSKAKDDVNRGKSPRLRNMNVTLKVHNDYTLEEGQGQERMSPRERKRSKYLSPPYTSLQQRQRISALEAGPDSGGMVFSDVAKMGEKMSKAAGKLVGSPPIVKCGGETFQKSPRGGSSAHGKTKTDYSDRQTRNGPDLRSKVDDSVTSIGSPNSVLCEIRSAALDPIHLRKKIESFDDIKGFLSSYRNANYKNGSNYHSFKKLLADQRKRKRKLSGSKNESNEPKTPGKSTLKKKEHKSESKAAALVINFPQDITLPSKEELMKIHSEFGPLNESMSKVVPRLSSAKIVFVKSLDAETAKNSLQENSPFGSTKVSYKVKHLSTDMSKTKEEKAKKGRSSKFQTPKSGKKRGRGASESEPLAVVFIKQKLESMTSMLGKADGKMTEEMKTNLEREVKELLKKVKMMTASCSSS